MQSTINKVWPGLGVAWDKIQVRITIWKYLYCRTIPSQTPPTLPPPPTANPGFCAEFCAALRTVKVELWLAQKSLGHTPRALPLDGCSGEPLGEQVSTHRSNDEPWDMQQQEQNSRLVDHKILLSLGERAQTLYRLYGAEHITVEPDGRWKVVRWWNYHIRDCSISSLSTLSSSFSPLLWCPLGTAHHYWVSSWVLWCQRHHPQWTMLEETGGPAVFGGLDSGSCDTMWHHAPSICWSYLTPHTSLESFILPSQN